MDKEVCSTDSPQKPDSPSSGEERAALVSTLQLHPDHALIPDMRSDEFEELVRDIAERGIVDPLVVDGSTVLDGRHRFRAAIRNSIESVPVRGARLRDGESARDYMLKSAVVRRHLTDDQRAMMAAMWAKKNPEPTGAAAHRKSSPTGGRLPGHEALRPALAKSAKFANVPMKRAERAASVLAKAPELAKKVHRGEMRLKEAEREIILAPQRAAVAAMEPAEGTFDVIVIDPPWRYENRPEEGDPTQRGKTPYPTMSPVEIAGLQVPAAASCVLWLWTTNAHMRDAFSVLDTWGFEQKTILTWVKQRIGLGTWLRGQTEHCILAVRGRPVANLTSQSTALLANAREHSRKPDEFYALVEGLCPGKRLEMFARELRPGWTSSGAETEKFST